MKTSEKIFSFIHSILGLINNVVLIYISYYCLFNYGDLYDVFSSPTNYDALNMCNFGLVSSMCYFCISCILMYLENNVTLSMIVHHTVILCGSLSLYITGKYINALIIAWTFELSSFFFTIRDALLKWKLKGRFLNIIEYMFVITFFMSRFTYVIYPEYLFLSGYSLPENQNFHYYIIWCGTCALNIINIYWGYMLAIGVYKRHLKNNK